jgi:hypothetical protein
MMTHGILAVWSDVDAAGEDDYNAWYEREHLFERLEVPGFHCGYHYLTVSGSPRYFTYFVTDNAAVMASQAYLAQANRPAPWTRRVLPYFRNTNRTACNVVRRIGRGFGVASLTIRLAAVAGREDEVISWLSETQLPAVVEQPGLIGAQVWRADRRATLVPVEDRRLRSEPDQVAELVVFVEGTLVDRLKAVAGGELSSDNLVAHGGDRPLIAIHQLLNGAEKYGLPTIEYRPV